MNTTIVVVTYNSAHLVGAIFGQLDIAPTLIFDNASVDDTVQIAQKNFPQATIIASPSNIGYGQAANMAFEKLETPYALLLNPDVEISLAQYQRLLAIPEQLDNNWLFIAPDTGNIIDATGEAAPNGLISVTHATGCALLFNLENFHKLGGFDPAIFLYYEEMDLCKRALAAGFKMYVAKNIAVIHNIKQSSAPSQSLDNLRNWHFQWSSLYYKRKHQLHRKYYMSLFKNLIASFPKQLISKKGKREKIRQKRAATIAFLCGETAFNENGEPFRPQ
jgi:GT2 family glycosyltransferase